MIGTATYAGILEKDPQHHHQFATADVYCGKFNSLGHLRFAVSSHYLKPAIRNGGMADFKSEL